MLGSLPNPVPIWSKAVCGEGERGVCCLENASWPGEESPPSLHKPPGNEANSVLLLLAYVSALVAMPWLVVRLVTELVPPLASRIATAALAEVMSKPRERGYRAVSPSSGQFARLFITLVNATSLSWSYQSVSHI